MIRINEMNPTLGNEISVAIPQPSAKEVFMQTAAAGAGVACVLGMAAGVAHGASKLYDYRMAKKAAASAKAETETETEKVEDKKKK